MQTLSGIEEFDPGDTPRGDLEIGVLGDDDGRLATELEDHRRELRGGGGHDLAAHLGAAGVQGEIETLREQTLGELGIAFGDHDGLRVEVVRNQPGEQRGRGGGQFRRFDHGTIPGGHCRDERTERQIHRVVPRCDDQDHSHRLVLHPAERGKLVERQGLRSRKHPAPDPLAGVGGFGPGGSEVGEPGFDRVSAQVLL